MTSSHSTALERQVTESVRIENRMGKQEEVLNTKSEWAGSKLPGLSVKAPVGVGKVGEGERGGKKSEKEIEEEVKALKRWEEALAQGVKRIPYIDSRGETGGIYTDIGGEGKRKKRRKMIGDGEERTDMGTEREGNERDNPKSGQCLETDTVRTEGIDTKTQNTDKTSEIVTTDTIVTEEEKEKENDR